MHHIDAEAAEEMIEKADKDVRSIIIIIVIKRGEQLLLITYVSILLLWELKRQFGL